MDFYSRLFAGGLSGGSSKNFKLLVSKDTTTITAEMLDGVTSIRRYAFYGAPFINITIPSSVTSIGGGAFSDSYLRSLTMLSTVPPTAGNNIFSGNTGGKIYVPAESVAAYRAASGWSSYKSKIQAIPS